MSTTCGDGTLLWLSHLLGDAPVPPVLAVGLGSLCFLSPFTVKQLEAAVNLGLNGGFHLTLRHRLTCRVVRCRPGSSGETQAAPAGLTAVCGGTTTHHVVLNECAIDRGAQALCNLECWMDNIFVTRVQGDGLIVATPSGSTAYNLAAGGSMAHPLVPGLLFTPICAHSLSFRPLVFPDSVHLCVRVPHDARGGCFASFDGRDRTELRPGDSVHIALSRWPMPTVCSRDSTTDWVGSIRNTLHWNERRTQGVARED
jgi:NAD+ kinase